VVAFNPFFLAKKALKNAAKKESPIKGAFVDVDYILNSAHTYFL